MRVGMLVALVVFLATAASAPAQSGGVSGRFSGTVVAKQAQRGMLVLSGPGGAGLSVHATAARARVGDRVALQARRLGDGTLRASRLRVLSHTRRAVIRGVVVRRLQRSTLVATGRSVITIRHATGADDRDLRAGKIADFRVRIDDDNELEEVAVAPVGQTANVRIEGRVVTVSPFVVSVEGLPITITIPAGMTLPAALTAGDRIELTVSAAAGNVFTLVSIDENENAVAPDQEQEQEVEVDGSVVSSTAGQLVVQRSTEMFTFVAPAGVTLPILPTGTRVEVHGVKVNGVLTLTRLKLEDNDESGGGGSSSAGSPSTGGGSSGGGDDGGGDDGGH